VYDNAMVPPLLMNGGDVAVNLGPNARVSVGGESYCTTLLCEGAARCDTLNGVSSLRALHAIT